MFSDLTFRSRCTWTYSQIHRQFRICSFESLSVGGRLNNLPCLLPEGHVREVQSKHLVAGMSLRALLVRGKSQELIKN